MKIPLNTELDINMNSIKDIVASKISKEIHQTLKEDYYARYSNEFKDIIWDGVTAFLAENKDEIIDGVIKNLTQRLANAKAVKEKLAIVLDEYKV